MGSAVVVPNTSAGVDGNGHARAGLEVGGKLTPALDDSIRKLRPDPKWRRRPHEGPQQTKTEDCKCHPAGRRLGLPNLHAWKNSRSPDLECRLMGQIQSFLGHWTSQIARQRDQ